MQVLIKPYTKKAKREFIKKYEESCRFEESDKALWALKYYEILKGNTVSFVLRDMKHQENNEKAKEARYNQEFSIEIQGQECIFNTSDETQRDLLTAFAVCSTGVTYDDWTTNNGVKLNLTLEDVTLIAAKFKELSNVYSKWNDFKEQIDKAVTVEELENIVIDYTEETKETELIGEDEIVV